LEKENEIFAPAYCGIVRELMPFDKRASYERFERSEVMADKFWQADVAWLGKG
jgi:hypothetical protein